MKGNTLEKWVEFIWYLMDLPKEKKHALSHNFKHECLYLGNMDELNLDQIYPGAEGKMTSLKKAYFNKESLDRAKKRLAEGANSVSISLQANDKTYTKQDHCMVSMVIYKSKVGYEVTVFYRVTEICRKFLFDLKFIREIIMPYMKINNYRITFFFTRVTLSLIFLHTLFLLYPDLLHKLLISEQDGVNFLSGNVEELFKDYLLYLTKMLERKEKGSMLMSHWRHFQKFRDTEEFKELYQYLENKYARTNKFLNKDSSKS